MQNPPAPISRKLSDSFMAVHASRFEQTNLLADFHDPSSALRQALATSFSNHAA
jgi:hypothetical protein